MYRNKKKVKCYQSSKSVYYCIGIFGQGLIQKDSNTRFSKNEKEV